MDTITLTEEQNRAVELAVRWAEDWAEANWPGGKQPQSAQAGIFAIGGPAGSGKTTCFRSLQERLKLRGLRAAPCAYTGKAASVLRAKGVPDAETIHSTIYDYDPEEDRFFERSAQALREAGVGCFLLDEASMVGTQLLTDLLTFGLPIIAVGDPFQLPPIGDGAQNLVERPDFLLTEVHRQALESPVLRLATEIRTTHNGLRIPFVPLAEAGQYERPDIWLCAFNKTRVGLNTAARAQLDFPTPVNEERCLFPGDRVVYLKNDRALQVFNGMRGRVLEVQEAISDILTERCLVAWEGEEDREKPTRWHNLNTAILRGATMSRSLAYECQQNGEAIVDYGHALTVHKAQGSEWPRVAVVFERWDEKWSPRRWLYTAVTRARDNVTIFA